MSLRLLFVINDELVEEVTIVRMEEFSGPNKVHRYEVVYDGVLIGYVEHLFSDRAFILAQKALQLVTESLS